MQGINQEHENYSVTEYIFRIALGPVVMAQNVET